MRNQARAGPLTLAQHLLKTGVTAVVGIRHTRITRSTGVKRPEQSQVARADLGATLERHQLEQVVAVHRQHVVEALEIRRLELARHAEQLVTATCSKRG